MTDLKSYRFFYTPLEDLSKRLGKSVMAVHFKEKCMTVEEEFFDSLFKEFITTLHESHIDEVNE